MRYASVFLTLLLGLLTPLVASARTLYWSSFDVAARLDAEGRLHVVERQTMVFTGDWNGGERRFRLASGQEIDLHGVVRFDPASGVETRLLEGKLDRVDRYDWTGKGVLRWRSRLPSDPPFDATTISYTLEYTLSNILQERRVGYRLDHDFAFADRSGPIEHFSLDLELDPVWESDEPPLRHLERESILPGMGVVLQSNLRFTGEGRPSEVIHGIPFALRLLLILASITAMVLLYVRLLRFERKQGRLAAVEIPDLLDRTWLEENLLYLRPEEAGAIWDQTIGTPEVTALLARLVAEGKLASSVTEKKGLWSTKPIMKLELLVDREDLESGYERRLIDKLLFDERTTTDTELIRKHYKSRGFSPSGVISAAITKRLRDLPGFGRSLGRPKAKPGCFLLGTCVLLAALELITRGFIAGPFVATLFSSALIPAAIGYVGAYWFRRRTEGVFKASLLFFIPMIMIGLPLFVMALTGMGPAESAGTAKLSIFGLAAVTLLPVVLLNSVFNAARTRDSKGAVRTRKILAAIRRHFQEELRSPDPKLEDDWLPYILAFGLGKQVDHWSARFAVPGPGSRTSTGSFSSFGTGGSSWSGGGGKFGGAGATTAWSVAAAGLAGGVSAPSSGGGSSGGGGGGGSSGGGGGGGW